MLRKKLIGYCAVDSGMIMLVDPCYVLPDKFDADGKLESHHGKDSYTYDKLMDFLTKNTDELHLKEGEREKEICFSGVGGSGVVVSSGDGDGYYPVYAYYKEGRVSKVTIDFQL